MVSLLFSRFDLPPVEFFAAGRDEPFLTLAFAASKMGRATIVIALAAACVLWLISRRRFAAAQALALAVAASGVGTLLIKGLVARARPPLEIEAYREAWYSFPSAHAAMSLAFYGTLAYLAWRSRLPPAFRITLCLLLVLLILAVGASRIYLGVHYPSDVLGGYLLGSACLALSVWTMRSFARGRMPE